MTVLSHVCKSIYKFQCSCGTVCSKNFYDVRAGKVKSCGHIKKSRQIRDITGERFGKLIAVEDLGFDKRSQRLYEFLCDCGCYTVKQAKEVTRGKSSSCGCGIVEGVKTANTKHGMTGTSLYSRYRGMIKRCTVESDPNYGNYGGRGINICSEWLGEGGFDSFARWSLENGYKRELSLDRIDNDKGYGPTNCRWTDRRTQVNNRRVSHVITYKGETLALTEWAEKFGLRYDSLWKRLYKYGYSFEDAVTKNTHRIEVG